MLPRLEAEERLFRISDNALGFGMVEQRDGDRVRKALERAASGHDAPVPAAARVDDMAEMGIAFVVVDDPAAQAGMSDG